MLASLVAINDARDGDRLRIALSSEAGLNDGTALPFLMLAVVWYKAGGTIGADEWLRWVSVDLVWALIGGLAIGFLLGRVIGLAATHSRHAQGKSPQRFHRAFPYLSELLAGHVGECVRFFGGVCRRCRLA